MKKKRVGLLNIRNKIFLSFIIPIISMVIVGVVSYENASEGMNDKFLESSSQTVNMATEYLELISTSISAEASRYVFDPKVENYILGMPGKDAVQKANFFSDEKLVLLSAEAANEFISGIHIVPRQLAPIVTTASGNKIDGIYDQYMEQYTGEDGSATVPKWITSHPLLDETVGMNPNDYFMSYQVQDGHKMGIIIVDVEKASLEGVISGIDFGEGSYVGLLTSDGKELSKKCGTEEILEEPIFAEASFYTDSIASGELSGNKEVTFNGEDYLYLYQTCEINGITLCAIIPTQTVTGQAESIKTITLILVLVAAALSVLIGTVIAAGIQNNMKRISKKLDEVANGNLSVRVEAKGKDEFQSLASSATNMVANNKNLVVKLTGAADSLQGSAKNVNDASEDIMNCSVDITQAIDEISKGVEKQSEHALECVNITNNLSEKIQNITTDVNAIETLVVETEDLIEKGKDIVNNLAKRARETTDITAAVGVEISKLQDETDSISEFVKTIGAIAKKTNLLSLNASIEAARAGEAGRGFAVVADEIRVLADNSASASTEIDSRVDNINAQTKDSVTSVENATKMVAKQQDVVDDVIDIFTQISDQMKVLVAALSKISDSAMEADSQRKETVDAVDNISAIIEQTAASSTMVRKITGNLKNSVDRLGATADDLDENMNGLKNEISAFTID